MLKDNIVAGLQGSPSVMTMFPVTGLVSDGNVYDVQSPLAWNGGTQTLATWRTVSGADLRSKQCAPVFVNAAAGNFRLDLSDVCAKSAGVSLVGITTWDIDGISRSATLPSIGASETSARAPATPTNVRIVK